MDAITPSSEEEKMVVEDEQEPMTVDCFRGRRKRKLVEEENSEETQHHVIRVFEQKTTEEETPVAASSSSQKESHQLDERKDEDAVERLGFMLEVLTKIEEEEKKELRKIGERIKRVEECNKRVEEMEKAAALVKQGVHSLKTSDRGVYVQASTLDSLEAFLEHLTSIDIPYFAVNIGPVVKEDVMKASTMLEDDVYYATILAFNVKVEKDAQMRADALGVWIIPVYNILDAGDQFFKHREECMKMKYKALSEVVLPCIAEALTSGIKSYEVFVEQGRLRVGTPLLARDRGNLELGVVTSISAANGSSVHMARAGDKVMLQMKPADENPVPARAKDRLISRVTRKSYDLCKMYCWKDFSDEEKDLLLQLLMASSLME